jgi:RNA polymerase sigma factor (sigma-70 family)
MDAEKAKSPELMNHYEGLVRTTASICVPYVEEDFDDICQFLRYKVWKALQSFDPASLRVKTAGRVQIAAARDGYVFSCLMNGKKDVLKKKRHGILFIEDIAPNDRNDNERSGHTMTRSSFEERYMAIEDAFGEIEQELPTIPSTLTASERAVVLLLYLDFKPAEIATERGLPRKEITSLVSSIREKMADWNPSEEARLFGVGDVAPAEAVDSDPFAPAPDFA